MGKQGGSVLVLSMVLMLTLIVLAAGMAVTINNEIHISRYEENMLQADYYAESAVEYASYLLADDSKWDDNELINEEKAKIVNLLNGLDIEKLSRNISGDEYIIDSVIKYNSVSRKLSVTYKIIFDDVYNNAIANYSNIHFNGNEKGEINGNIKTAGKIEDVQAGSDMVFNGEWIEGQDPEFIPDYNDFFTTDYTDLVFDQNSQNTLNFNQEIKDIDYGVVFDKELTILGEGILVVKGHLTFKKHTKINKNSDDFFIIICSDNVLFEESAKLEGNFLLYAEGHIHFKEQVDMKGTIISRDTIQVNNKFELTQDRGYLDVFSKMGILIPGTGSNACTRKITDWQEF
ncbi:hypothetical protein GM661_11505 [Iocasia frigidifontis]|uniref:Type 4 fimbrial biogenesis protein PilX N-terminal domain-containing protein n=1 Tax=Iocasia fonsfrigidae TaxID=2682810 RepID=A0A8A7KI68_9FIRM|nr:hypothetical protein [Iocasia fonsfrigidae]QTL98547.1 hypothetical protein GM661_11505 [Iocasia fonsfrigidae]